MGQMFSRRALVDFIDAKKVFAPGYELREDQLPTTRIGGVVPASQDSLRAYLLLPEN